ncbi:MAG: hypothetical protein IKR37_03145 [Paludibacteraceae bacterium]|nr:hypothetical protein [Paludibacteraceae bacterium]
MIYQVLIDRFNGGWTTPPANDKKFLGGTLKGVIEKLDYIRAQGATSVWLSPFLHNAENSYHGYHTIDFEQIDPHFGTWQDLQTLIDTAHTKGMKVIADFVPNHCHIDHPFFQDALKRGKESPYRNWFYFKNDHSDEYQCFLQFTELAKFNLDNPETAQYLIGVGERLSKMGIDGFRIDHAVGMPMSFLKQFRDRMHALNPDTVVFGEVWAFGVKRKDFKLLRFKSCWHKLYYWLFGLNQECLQRDYKGVLDGVLDFQFRDLLVSEVEAGHRLLGNEKLECKLKKHFSRYPDESFKVYPFVDNHDTNRFLHYCHGDNTLLDEALELMRRLGKEYVVYYGTECYMTNDRTIENAEPYADLRVREPMKW